MKEITDDFKIVEPWVLKVYVKGFLIIQERFKTKNELKTRHKAMTRHEVSNGRKRPNFYILKLTLNVDWLNQ